MKATTETIARIGTDYDMLAWTQPNPHNTAEPVRVLIIEHDGGGYGVEFHIGALPAHDSDHAATPEDAAFLVATHGLGDEDWSPEDADL